VVCINKFNDSKIIVIHGIYLLLFTISCYEEGVNNS
jgi:hypothetical protein